MASFKDIATRSKNSFGALSNMEPFQVPTHVQPRRRKNKSADDYPKLNSEEWLVQNRRSRKNRKNSEKEEKKSFYDKKSERNNWTPRTASIMLTPGIVVQHKAQHFQYKGDFFVFKEMIETRYTNFRIPVTQETLSSFCKNRSEFIESHVNHISEEFFNFILTNCSEVLANCSEKSIERIKRRYFEQGTFGRYYATFPCEADSLDAKLLALKYTQDGETIKMLVSNILEDENNGITMWPGFFKTYGPLILPVLNNKRIDNDTNDTNGITLFQHRVNGFAFSAWSQMNMNPNVVDLAFAEQFFADKSFRDRVLYRNINLAASMVIFNQQNRVYSLSGDETWERDCISDHMQNNPELYF